jgi:hypothetical protein
MSIIRMIADGTASRPVATYRVDEPAPGRRFIERTNSGMLRVAVLPHPSGLCRIWNLPDAVDRARATMREAGVAL